MLTFIRRRATLRGPLGGSREWTALWALLVAVRLVRRFTRRSEEIVFSHRLAPGERLVISGDGTEPRIVGGR